MKLGKLVTRVVVGTLFIGHGTQKLFGWFDGPGPDKPDREQFESGGLGRGAACAVWPGRPRPAAAPCWRSACSPRLRPLPCRAS